MPRRPSIQSQLVECASGCILTPFTILIDRAEKHPWTFPGLVARSFVDREQRVYHARTQPAYLGIGRGDYSLLGYEDRIAIERKSLEDFQGTLLGWEKTQDRHGVEEWDTDASRASGRRDRFKRELATLQKYDFASVIVEANWEDVLRLAPSWGKRSSEENAKYLMATYISWRRKYRGVQWEFCSTRELAEVTAFRSLEQWWAEEQRQQRRRREVAEMGLFD